MLNKMFMKEGVQYGSLNFKCALLTTSSIYRNNKDYVANGIKLDMTILNSVNIDKKTNIYSPPEARAVLLFLLYNLQ